MEKKSVSKLMLLLKSTIFIVLATLAFNASANCCKVYKTYKYRCAYTTSYVTHKWIPGYYRHCCWVPGRCVDVVHYKKHYKTYHVTCAYSKCCNSCSHSLFGWF